MDVQDTAIKAALGAAALAALYKLHKAKKKHDMEERYFGKDKNRHDPISTAHTAMSQVIDNLGAMHVHPRK